MKRTPLAVAALLWSSVFVNALLAQPILNRIEGFIRDQIGTRGAPQMTRPAEPGYLGLTADDRQTGDRSVRIVELVPGGPAERGGLRTGDVIASIGGQPVRTMDDVARIVQSQREGTRLMVGVRRNNGDMQREVVLGRRPAAQPTPAAAPPAGPGAEELPAPAAQAPPSSVMAQFNKPGPRLGVRTVAVTDQARQENNLPDARGALITSIVKDSPADRAGIPSGAVIVGLGSDIIRPISTPEELGLALAAEADHPEVEVMYIAKGQAARKTVTLSDGPAAAPAAAPTLAFRPAETPEDAPDAPATGAEARIAALEARIRELEARLAKFVEAAAARAPAASEEPAGPALTPAPAEDTDSEP